MVFEHHYLRSIYKMRPQDGPQEMERNEAKAKPVAWPSCAWVQLSFFPFPVGNPMSAGCRVAVRSYRMSLQATHRHRRLKEGETAVTCTHFVAAQAEFPSRLQQLPEDNPLQVLFYVSNIQ